MKTIQAVMSLTVIVFGIKLLIIFGICDLFEESTRTLRGENDNNIVRVNSIPKY